MPALPGLLLAEQGLIERSMRRTNSRSSPFFPGFFTLTDRSGGPVRAGSISRDFDQDFGDEIRIDCIVTVL